MKNILLGHITIKMLASNGENPFFGRNGQKGCHGCVKSEHGTTLCLNIWKIKNFVKVHFVLWLKPLFIAK